MQIVFSLRKGAPDLMGMISLITSWAQLGSSMGKVILLKDLLPYHKKQVQLHDVYACCSDLERMQARKVKALEELVGRQGVELTSVNPAGKSVLPAANQ